MGLFEHYQATPAAISSAAEGAGTAGSAVRRLSSAVEARSQVAASNVFGTLAPPMLAAPDPVVSKATQLNGAALVAQGCLNRWSQAVHAYNDGIDRLNERYETAKASNFGVDADSFFMRGAGVPVEQKQAAYDTAVANADSALKAELAAEQAKLEKELDAEATDVAGMLDEGPTDNVVMALFAGGFLPMSVASSFPGLDPATLNTIRKYVSMAKSVWGAPDKVRKLINYFRTAKDLSAVAAELAANEKQWGAILSAVEQTLDTRTMASLNTYMQAQEELSHLQYTKLFAEGDNLLAGRALVDAATMTGKLGTFLGVTGLVAGGYDLYDLANNWDQTSTEDKILRLAGGTTGMLSGGGGLLAAAGVITLGPVGAGVLLTAGLVSAGIAVYQNWDEITHGVSVAADFVGDQIDAGIEQAGEALGDLKDAAGDVLDDITPW